MGASTPPFLIWWLSDTGAKVTAFHPFDGFISSLQSEPDSIERASLTRTGLSGPSKLGRHPELTRRDTRHPQRVAFGHQLLEPIYVGTWRPL